MLGTCQKYPRTVYLHLIGTGIASCSENAVFLGGGANCSAASTGSADYSADDVIVN